MSVDAFAILKIEKLVTPRDETLGVPLPVRHHGDASIVSTWTRYGALTPDEFSLALRKIFGEVIDAHDDARGILFFPDVCEYRGHEYRTIVEELEPSGFWAPKVGIDHVPVRYTNAEPGSHDALVREMIERMGRDEAVRRDLILAAAAIGELIAPDGASGMNERLTELESAMGAEFAARYSTSARERARMERERHEAQRASADELAARMMQGEPLVSAAEIGAFVEGGGADAVFRNFDPKLRAALEEQLASVDTDALPNDDLARVLKLALERTKR